VKTDTFCLQVVRVSDVVPHEEFDDSRANALVERLSLDGYLVHPIMVAGMDDGRYLELDGMNRLSAFRALGIPTIAAQVVDYSNPDSFDLSSWVHLIRGEMRELLEQARSLEGVALKESNVDHVGYRYVRDEGLARICAVVEGREVHLLGVNGDLAGKVDKLRALCSIVHGPITRDVLPARPSAYDVAELFSLYPDKNLMLIFPIFTQHQILKVVKSGAVFPGGVTRHMIKPRCLGAKVPLSLFTSGKSLEEQNRELDELLSCRRLRIYEEPTVQFE
jgi:hypothetical protein